MIPTMKLRFVERTIHEPVDNVYGGHGVAITKTVKRNVLQQWWREEPDVALMVYRKDMEGNVLPPLLKGEWRDVPLEKDMT